MGKTYKGNDRGNKTNVRTCSMTSTCANAYALTSAPLVAPPHTHTPPPPPPLPTTTTITCASTQCTCRPCAAGPFAVLTRYCLARAFPCMDTGGPRQGEEGSKGEGPESSCRQSPRRCVVVRCHPGLSFTHARCSPCCLRGRARYYSRMRHTSHL